MSVPFSSSIALTIAGSDSGGGAGIQADLKTFHQWRVFGVSAITAVTAQNTLGVSAIHPIPGEILYRQIADVATDLPPAAFKTGMLGGEDSVGVVARAMDDFDLGAFVLDPVLVASSGDRLSDQETLGAILEKLAPRATLLTPNYPEAALLTGNTVENLDDARAAAHTLVSQGAGAVLVKGGHGQGPEALDLFWDGEVEEVFTHPRIDTRNTHGTGCSLAAAIVANLVHGETLTIAVARSVDWLQRAIASAPGLGSGDGPINHHAALP